MTMETTYSSTERLIRDQMLKMLLNFSQLCVKSTILYVEYLPFKLFMFYKIYEIKAKNNIYRLCHVLGYWCPEELLSPINLYGLKCNEDFHNLRQNEQSVILKNTL